MGTGSDPGKTATERIQAMNEYKFQRNLDGVYFRVKRGDKYENVCFSDLNEDEMRKVLKGKKKDWLFEMCITLGNTIYDMGQQLQVVRIEDETEEQ